MNHRAICLDPNPKCPASYVCDETIVSEYNDINGLTMLGEKSDIITYEFENVKAEPLKFIKDNEGATIPEIEMFTDCSRAIINTLIKNDYLEVVEQKAERNPLLYKDVEKIREKESSSKLELTEEQKEAYKNVENVIEEKRYQQFLLYGVTGSRKNRSLFTINTKSIGKRKISDYISTRDIINTTDAR